MAMVCCVGLIGCGGGDAELSPIAKIGEKAFAEPLLSATLHLV
jgi:hypothetical protein